MMAALRHPRTASLIAKHTEALQISFEWVPSAGNSVFPEHVNASLET